MTTQDIKQALDDAAMTGHRMVVEFVGGEVSGPLYVWGLDEGTVHLGDSRSVQVKARLEDIREVTAYLHYMSLDGMCDEETGDVEWGSWFGRIGKRILEEDSQGFCTVTRFRTEAEAEKVFQEIADDYSRWDGGRVITYEELPESPASDVAMYCSGGCSDNGYSATRGDYFLNNPKDIILCLDCGSTMFLGRKVTTIEPL